MPTRLCVLQLILGTVRVRWARHQQYYDQDAWRGTWAWMGACSLIRLVIMSVMDDG